MDKQYLAWLRELRQDTFFKKYNDTAWAWLKAKVWRDFYKRGIAPADAAYELLAW